MVQDLDARAREVFKLIVDSYLSTGEPMGSRTLSQQLNKSLSPASVRNVMAELEDLGFLYSPHTSAGRLPTERGLRLYVDGMMEIGNLRDAERREIDSLAATDAGLDALFEKASQVVSGLSSCATVVATPSRDRAVSHIQFIPFNESRALAVLMFTDGSIENRMIDDLPQKVPAASLTTASNFLNARLRGRTLGEARTEILDEIRAHKSALDTLSAKVVEQGLAIADRNTEHFYVRGTANLLDGVKDIEALQKLIDLLEREEVTERLLQATEGAQGVKIFIGSENRLFSHSGMSMVLAPARNAKQQVVGAIGVIGPTRLNYGRIVPIVDYTSQVIARLIRP